MEKKLIEAGWKLVQAIDHHEDMREGYANGSASIASVRITGEQMLKAKSELWDVLKESENALKGDTIKL